MALNIVADIDDKVSINNVLISVSDKTGLEDLVRGLISINPDIKIYSTGGTYNKISELLGNDAVKNLISVSDYTGQPEMQGGLVKTLDFKIYLGLLSETYNEAHKADLSRTGAVAFDMVVVNLYPFSETIKQDGITAEEARTNIDIGGPCMLRASAKNYLRVASVCNPSDYEKIIREMKSEDGKLSLEFRFELAKKTFSHTAEYDSQISSFLLSKTYNSVQSVYSFKGGR